jgi:hypothetical protein
MHGHNVQASSLGLCQQHAPDDRISAGPATMSIPGPPQPACSPRTGLADSVPGGHSQGPTSDRPSLNGRISSAPHLTLDSPHAPKLRVADSDPSPVQVMIRTSVSNSKLLAQLFLG